jgi:hypothetical protein
MYFSLLREILSPDRQYEIYLDIKDTRSRRKIAKLREVLCYDKYDFTSEMIVNLQNIRSHESQLIQIADFLVGAVSYKHRYIVRAQSAPISQAKSRLITIIEHSIKADLGKSTSRHADKINLFCFTPRQVHQ